MANARLLRTGHLDGTIDGHDPIFATFRVSGGLREFLLSVYSVNLGRGYTHAQFLANIKRVFAHASRGTRYIVILLQEIDEADPSKEHAEIRKMVVDMFGDDAHFIQWYTRESIILIGADIEVLNSRKRMTMDQGTMLKPKAPSGTGPRRFITWVRFRVHGVVLGAANQHPHRYSLRARGVVLARARGERVTRIVLAMLVRICEIVFDGGDLNTPNYPKSHPDQKVAIRRGLDYIRWIVSRNRRKP